MEETSGEENESLADRSTCLAAGDITEKSSHETVASVPDAVCVQEDSGGLETLQAQQERERKRQTLLLYESRRRQTIEERRGRLALRPEPRDGVYIQVKYGDGSESMRRFCLKQSIQILFDFAGLDAMATDVFHIQTASSSTATPSTATGALCEHGFTGPCTVYALWLSPEEVQEKLAESALVAVPTPPSPVHSTAALFQETTAASKVNTAPSGSQENFNFKGKEQAVPPGGTAAEAVEDSIVALSWPWFIPIEEAAVEKHSLNPAHSSVTSLPNPHPRSRSRRIAYRWLLERERAELEASRMELEEQRAELERERAELEQERADLQVDRAELAQDIEREEEELERERAELEVDRAHVEHSRRILFLFQTLLQKL